MGVTGNPVTKKSDMASANPGRKVDFTKFYWGTYVNRGQVATCTECGRKGVKRHHNWGKPQFIHFATISKHGLRIGRGDWCLQFGGKIQSSAIWLFSSPGSIEKIE